MAAVIVAIAFTLGICVGLYSQATTVGRLQNRHVDDACEIERLRRMTRELQRAAYEKEHG